MGRTGWANAEHKAFLVQFGKDYQQHHKAGDAMASFFPGLYTQFFAKFPSFLNPTSEDLEKYDNLEVAKIKRRESWEKVGACRRYAGTFC